MNKTDGNECNNSHFYILSRYLNFRGKWLAELLTFENLFSTQYSPACYKYISLDTCFRITEWKWIKIRPTNSSTIPLIFCSSTSTLEIKSVPNYAVSETSFLHSIVPLAIIHWIRYLFHNYWMEVNKIHANECNNSYSYILSRYLSFRDKDLIKIHSFENLSCLWYSQLTFGSLKTNKI